MMVKIQDHAAALSNAFFNGVTTLGPSGQPMNSDKQDGFDLSH